MKKIRGSVLAVLISVVLAANAFADDYPRLKFIGFSQNGKYLAFEETGEWNSLGDEYATTYYIETAKNSYARAPSDFSWTRESSRKSKNYLLLRYRRSVAANLKRFAIIPGNEGQLVAAHLLNDLSFVKPVMREQHFERSDGTQTNALRRDYEGGFVRLGSGLETVIFNPNIDSFWQGTGKLRQNTGEFYELALKTFPAAGKDCGESYKIELTLQDNTKHREMKPQILQKDADILPESRPCAAGYKIERVYFYVNDIVVFINVFSEAGRKMEMSYLAVTGELKEK